MSIERSGSLIEKLKLKEEKSEHVIEVANESEKSSIFPEPQVNTTSPTVTDIKEVLKSAGVDVSWIDSLIQAKEKLSSRLLQLQKEIEEKQAEIEKVEKSLHVINYLISHLGIEQ